MRKLKLFLDAKAANTPPRGISKASRVIFSVLTLLFLSIGQMWGADVMYPDGTNFTTAWTKSSRTAKQTYASKTALQMMGKNKGVYGEIISENSYSNISGISINCTANNAVALKLYYSADKSDWTELSSNTISKNTSGYSDYDLTITGIPSTAVYLKLESQANSIYMYSVTVSTGSSSACATPTFSPAAGAVLSGTEVSISCATEGATVHYTLDGSDPTASSATAQPISITSATTIKAIAVKEGMDNSSVASAAYTIATPLASMEEIFAASATAGNYYITFSNLWVVTGVSTNGKNVYITDGTKGMILFNNSGNMGLVVGNTLSGTVQRSLKKYNGAAELDGFTTEGLTVGTADLPNVQVLDAEGVAALSGVNTGSLIKISGTCDIQNSKCYVAGVQLYNALFAFESPADGSNCTVSGVYAQYNNTKEILPRSQTDIVETVTKYTVTITTPENGTLAVLNGEDAVNSGDELNENTELTISAQPAAGYKLVGVTVNGNAYAESTLTLTENVTIAASFEENEAPLVETFILSEIGTESSHLVSGQRVGDKVNLPETAATCSKVFRGWDADENCATVPTYAPGAEYTLALNNKLYAVYADATPGSTWEVATSVKAGDVIVISTNTGYTAHDMKTAGAISGTLLGTTASTYGSENETITELAEGTLQFTVGGNATNGWTLKNGTKYLAATAAKKVALQDEVATWSIAFSGNVATVTYSNTSYGDLQYNYNSGNDRFTTYASAQTAISLYKPSVNYSNYSTDCQAAVATPTFSVEAGTYTEVQSVEISCTTAGALIYYTTNGDEPTENSTLYEGAIEVAADMTIKAIAVKSDLANSAVASAAYKINLPVYLTTMDEIYEAATQAGGTATDVNVMFSGWVVSGVSTNGKQVYVTDGTKGFIIFDNGGNMGFAVGDVLSGTVACKVQLYNGAAELTTLSSTTEGLNIATGGSVTPVEKAISALSGVNTGAPVIINSVQYDGTNLTDGANSIKPYNSLFAYEALENGKYYNVTGIYLQFGANTKEILPRSAEDIEDVTPAPKYTVRLWNTASGWDAVNAHVWNATGNITEWPGEATTFAAGWNTFEVEEGNSLLFCKADGSAQTVDITEVTADACYVLTGEADGSGHLEVALDTECADRFYVAGNTELTGEYWNAAGARLQNGYVTFTNVPAGDHEFKVTNGSWNWERGTAAFDSENSNVENTGTNNVGFTTYGAKDITIAYDEANNKIAVQAEDYVAPAEPEYRAVVVAYGDKYYAMTTTLNNKGFTPLEVTIDGEGNVVVNSEEERSSILWKFTEGNGTAMFQDAEDKYLAHTGTGTDLMLQAADTENPEVWTWDSENGCYYVAVTKDNKTTNRSFFYQENANKFKNYGIETNLGKNGYSGAPVFYAADKVLVSTTAKLKFFAPVAWESVKAYTWEGTSTGDHEMTAVEEGSRWFECDIEKGVPFLIYNGTWNGSNQTANIDAIDADKCFAWTAATDSEDKIIATEITSCEMSYYIAGDEVLTGVAEWGHKALSNNALTFNEVADGTYKFKITNGSWDWNLGAAYVDANACENVTIEETDNDGNVVFTIDAASNITIAYNPATEKISIVADVPTPKEYYTKVTSTEDITAGTYLIVYEGANLVFDGGLTTLDAVSNTIPVTISEGKIEVTDQTEAAAFFIDPEIGTIKSASGKYIGVLSNSNGLKQSEKIYTYKNAFSIDGDGNAVIAADFEGSNMVLRYNSGTNQNRFRYYGGNQQPIQLYKKAEAAKASPELAFAQSAVEAIKGDAFVAPTLSNEHNVTVAYEASNNKASVDAESGEVTINNAGEVTIYAVSAANDEYRESYAKYTISIKAYETIRGSLELNRYYTICLNKNITDVKGATFWNLTYKDADQATKVFIEEAETLEAGKPYVFQATADKLEVMYGTEIEDEPVANGALRGTFDGLDEDEFAALQGNIYILKDNAIRPRTEGNFLGANRAYIEFDALEVAPAQGFAPGRRVRAIPMQQNGATGFENIEASEKPMKLMIDGKIYILRGEKMYDATGRLVK